MGFKGLRVPTPVHPSISRRLAILPEPRSKTGRQDWGIRMTIENLLATLPRGRGSSRLFSVLDQRDEIPGVVTHDKRSVERLSDLAHVSHEDLGHPLCTPLQVTVMPALMNQHR